MLSTLTPVPGTEAYAGMVVFGPDECHKDVLDAMQSLDVDARVVHLDGGAAVVQFALGNPAAANTARQALFADQSL